MICDPPVPHESASVVLCGHPWHGLCASGTLTLPNAATMTYTQPATSRGYSLTNIGPIRPISSDCHIFKRPGHVLTPIADTDAERHAAAGQTWKDHAILSGDTRQLYGTALGATSWLVEIGGAVWKATLSSAALTQSTDTLNVTVSLAEFGRVDGATAATASLTPSLNPAGQSGLTDANFNVGLVNHSADGTKTILGYFYTGSPGYLVINGLWELTISSTTSATLTVLKSRDECFEQANTTTTWSGSGLVCGADGTPVACGTPDAGNDETSQHTLLETEIVQVIWAWYTAAGTVEYVLATFTEADEWEQTITDCNSLNGMQTVSTVTNALELRAGTKSQTYTATSVTTRILQSTSPFCTVTNVWSVDGPVYRSGSTSGTCGGTLDGWLDPCLGSAPADSADGGSELIDTWTFNYTYGDVEPIVPVVFANNLVGLVQLRASDAVYGPMLTPIGKDSTITTVSSRTTPLYLSADPVTGSVQRTTAGAIAYV